MRPLTALRMHVRGSLLVVGWAARSQKLHHEALAAAALGLHWSGVSVMLYEVTLWLCCGYVGGFPGGQTLCLLMQETRVRALGRGDPLEEDMASHSRILAWRIPCTEEPGGLQSRGRRRRTQLSGTRGCGGGRERGCVKAAAPAGGINLSAVPPLLASSSSLFNSGFASPGVGKQRRQRGPQDNWSLQQDPRYRVEKVKQWE